MTNIILIAILLLVAGGAILYLYKAKKQGKHCVGCPHAKTCETFSCNCNSLD